MKLDYNSGYPPQIIKINILLFKNTPLARKIILYTERLIPEFYDLNGLHYNLYGFKPIELYL